MTMVKPPSRLSRELRPPIAEALFTPPDDGTHEMFSERATAAQRSELESSSDIPMRELPTAAPVAIISL